jgi:hypothetical protein
MERNRLLSAGVAALCMVSIGLSATTLDSTVSQDPGDVIAFDGGPVPVDDGTVRDLARQVQRNEGGDATGERGERRPGADDAAGEAGERSDRRNGRPDDSGAERVASGERAGDDGAPAESLVERLVALLERFAPLLVALVAVALSFRYRERLWALFCRPTAAVRARVAAGGGGDPSPWPGVEPVDDVDRAWCALVRELDVDRPWTKTPGECRRAAVEAGFDPEAVATLTRVFREKRYGEAGPTDAHVERARECVDRIGLRGRPR